MATRKQSHASIGADADLAALGYTAELPRNLSMFSVLGLSFAIMAVPFGLSTTLTYALINGQSVTVFWGWILLSLLSLAIAASLAEICSVYPTAGGVYYWAALLSSRRWAPITSWITGWLTLVGNWTVTLSINFSGAQLILSAVTLWDPDFAPSAWLTVLVFWGVMLVALLTNIVLASRLDLLNKLCVYWTGASVVILLITLLACGATSSSYGLNSGAFVFANYDASASGWPVGWSFFVGLLNAAYTLTGYGMVAAMCEEVANPAREVPRAIVLSVLAAGLTGIVYLIPLLFALPPIDLLLAVSSGQPIALVFATVTGSPGGGFGLLFLILGILFFAGVGALTAASRCTYAFARDGAIPGSRWWSRVDARTQVPLNALLLSALVDALLGCIYFGSTAAFNSFTGVATICLNASYGLPILISVLRGRRDLQGASFSLGRFGLAINILTICWICLAVVIFCCPTSVNGLTAGSMNYASVVFAGFALISVVWYAVRGRKDFSGPPIVRGEVVEATREVVTVGEKPVH